MAFSASQLHTSLSPQNPPPPRSNCIGIEDNEICLAMTPREFLLEQPPGPYTCLRARGFALLGFDFHLQRLVSSIAASGAGGKDGVKASELRGEVLDVIQEKLEDLARRREDEAGASKSSFPPPPLDTFVTIHVTPSPSLKITAHAIPMPYAVMPAPITLEVRGEGRQNPHIKHSQWVRDREDLERYRVGAGGEVALSRPSSSSSSSAAAGAGRELLEGLVTNLFALHKGTLRTPAEDGILPGHMRQMAINAAKSLNIPVDTTTPLKISEISEWDEAFLTGSGRVCVPIQKVEGDSLGLFSVELPVVAPGPVTNRIRQRMLWEMDEGWEGVETLRNKLR